ncbi:DUF6615 family protein [Sphingomonas humi]|uniref:DUF6615 family protein n=1 Tax=Sphingomonas humi TaxID=335630 RepID=UPI0031DBC05F
MLELGHATSQNLGFAHRGDVHVSYGEETITETNLLELRRRHPAIISLKTFGKKSEGLNGADWEWHILGRARKLRMRVQAKRLQRNDRLTIPHTVASSGKQQIDLLIADAKTYGMKPVYCIYAAENQRAFWAKKGGSIVGDEFEYGCLLISAYKIKAAMPKALSTIEADCIPWHYLVERRRYSETKMSGWFKDGPDLSFLSLFDAVSIVSASAELTDEPREFPTIDELNAVNLPETTFDGVVEIGSPEYEFSLPEEAYLERGITKLVQIDVRDIPPGYPEF